MREPPPDRVSVFKDSPHHHPQCGDIGVRLNGVERNADVYEYCVSEGWARVRVGKGFDRRGNPLTMKVVGTVAPYWR